MVYTKRELRGQARHRTPESSTDPRKNQDLLPRDGEISRGRTWYKKSESMSFCIMQKRTCHTENHVFECHEEARCWVQ